ncbi:precorrin-6A synthase (deacetylating) [Microbispora triticiradicis]|uniref:precorrin-6A synthase (deacetylating) n=1 Tax=Microbispora triticiradicis TaxID=2200763 RepID=UPI001AD7C56A|nr:precorrin-6A synthase (deacetylating) [Microbispora triticiradicis]MBO4273647.1 precorrin-6A synthase (deacetylating) [Microbispora triticiradicis]
MKRVLIIGIGAGDPAHLTFQAAAAIAETDVFFLLDKGAVKDGLVRLRRELIAAHAREPYRTVEARDPERDRTSGAYVEAVADWRARRADVYARLIAEEVPEDGVGAFLVWGDPALYDSTIAIVEDVLARGAEPFGYEVIPGISSVSALAARHRVSLTRVARPLHITTGRRLPADVEAAGDIVVMLDAGCAFADLPEAADADVYWGAYVGTEDEILVAGPVREVAGEIRRLRAEAREAHGWVMDTYLLRKPAR